MATTPLSSTMSQPIVAPFLPLEILTMIADYAAERDDKDEKLGPYALVSKAWQAVFEPHIYKSLKVLSPSETTTISLGVDGNYGVFDKCGITLERLSAVTGGPERWCRARRAAIRSIAYHVAVPHHGYDHMVGVGETLPSDQYDSNVAEAVPVDAGNNTPRFLPTLLYHNSSADQNDEAFTSGVASLFDLLSTWTDQNYPFSLSIALQAENIYTLQNDESEERNYNNCIGEYGANFSAGFKLRTVNCISSLEFPQEWSPVPINYIRSDYNGRETLWTSPFAAQSWIHPNAALFIASFCRGQALSEIRIHGSPLIPEAERALVMQRRDSIADMISRVPRSVRVFHLQCRPDEMDINYLGPYRPAPPRFDHLPDPLSQSLRVLSTQLKSLTIRGLEVLPQLFDRVEGDSWPLLEHLCLEQIPRTLFDDNSYLRPQSVLQEFYSNLGRAACRMPRIKFLLLSYGEEQQGLKFEARDSRCLESLESAYGKEVPEPVGTTIGRFVGLFGSRMGFLAVRMIADIVQYVSHPDFMTACIF
ncbi:uncharacterized protein RCC_01559 [Ramularia collo-cygni]|uniref:F-box domain-containing protein n=1 Tax=Ramularia collo-cygni TaxID=112498 RepID=A0A2D3UQU5_9PEZI|nr:uncharacterized protein RCC_01559 [Ramularia collo-cygni]CZT15725.1 uncharacterized protein RCC_01559 [Ramularia collo-cygni]